MTQDGTEVTCSTCVHWKRVGASDQGKCRRYPPSQPSRVAYNWSQPQTLDIDTCGEWRQRDESFVTRALRVMDAIEAPPIDQGSSPSALAPIPATTGAPAALGLPALPVRSDDEVR